MVRRTLWLNGTVGSGKTTVGAAVADRLVMGGEPTAFVDTDALGGLSPRPPDDPFNTRLVAKNLMAVAANFAAAGARSLVVAGVVQTPDDLERYEQVIGAPITLVRLLVPARDGPGVRRVRSGLARRRGAGRSRPPRRRCRARWPWPSPGV